MNNTLQTNALLQGVAGPAGLLQLFHNNALARPTYLKTLTAFRGFPKVSVPPLSCGGAHG